MLQLSRFISDSVQPHRQQPTRLPRPWDSPGKNTGVGCPFLLQCIKVKSESEVAQSCPTLSDPMTAAYQAPPSMGFSRQEYYTMLYKPHKTVWLHHFLSSLLIWSKTFQRVYSVVQEYVNLVSAFE